jgi:hypothetical protein
MLSHRVGGLWNTYHGVLVVILTFVFWIYLAIISVVFKYIASKNFSDSSCSISPRLPALQSPRFASEGLRYVLRSMSRTRTGVCLLALNNLGEIFEHNVTA